jgi:hypothetical protein
MLVMDRQAVAVFWMSRNITLQPVAHHFSVTAIALSIQAHFGGLNIKHRFLSIMRAIISGHA